MWIFRSCISAICISILQLLNVSIGALLSGLSQKTHIIERFCYGCKWFNFFLSFPLGNMFRPLQSLVNNLLFNPQPRYSSQPISICCSSRAIKQICVDIKDSRLEQYVTSSRYIDIRTPDDLKSRLEKH